MNGEGGRILCGDFVERLRPGARDIVVWDSGLPGFGVRVYPSGRKVYVVQARAGGAPRRATIGAHGEIGAEEARARAEAELRRIKAGGPRRGPATLAELAERYMTAHVAATCNAHTASIYRGALENHILPALGAMPLAAIGRADVAALHRGLRETPRAANRALAILKKMFALAESWGMAPEGSNPCTGVRKYRERRRERFLTPAEYRRLGAALAEAEAEGWASPAAVAALRLLALTGCRLGEILALRWDDVDRAAGELRLREAKAGARMVPLTPTAEAVLAAIPRTGNPWVIAGRRPNRRVNSITAEWYRIRARAGLGDVRIHDLRHSYATRALSSGESLAMIGRLLGHADIASTLRYAHLAHGAERQSAARIGGSIGASLDARPS
ncbi:MAG: tyrosine-type recombinase/integrase [Rhodospirillales bacterium]|nr:tyrosine-type recombinase/integrase [Rhodospirillales bacterium]